MVLGSAWRSSHGTLLRMGSVLLVVALLLGFFAVAPVQAKKKKRRTLPPPPPDLPGHVDYLVRQLAGVPVDEGQALTGQVQKLVLDHLTAWMARTPLSSGPEDVPVHVKVRRELEHAFSKLRHPRFGRPAVFSEDWRDAKLIAAGYTLGWTDYDRANVVALFESREGKTRLAAVTNFLPRTDLHYEILPPSPSGDFRFFVYGWRLGKSQLRLTAILYAYDGESLKSLWETQDVYDGKMDVGEQRVVIRYLKEEEYVREILRGRKPPRHEASYRITPGGLELEMDREVPF